MSKKKKIVLGILCAFLVFGIGVGITVFMKISESMELQPIENINLQEVKDGTYTGNADNGIVKVEVEVEVLNHKIEKITVLKHDNGLGGKAEEIVDDILNQQTLEVDAISSATYSSNTILKAIENALEKGL